MVSVSDSTATQLSVTEDQANMSVCVEISWMIVQFYSETKEMAQRIC